jgi:hypothetical protein
LNRPTFGFRRAAADRPNSMASSYLWHPAPRINPPQFLQRNSPLVGWGIWSMRASEEDCWWQARRPAGPPACHLPWLTII